MDINTSYSSPQLYPQRNRQESTTPTLEETIEQQNAAMLAQAQNSQTSQSSAQTTAQSTPTQQIQAVNEQNTALQSSINAARFSSSNVLQNEQMLRNVLNIL